MTYGAGPPEAEPSQPGPPQAEPAQPDAAWYDDPHTPGRMRYFDGVAWTNHFHWPGKLPDISSWIGASFTVFRQYWQGAVAIALGFSLIGNVIGWFGIRYAISDIAIVDESFVNVETGPLVVGGVLVLVSALWQVFSWLALSRYMQRAHFQANPTVGEAMQRALQRFPKFLALLVALFLGGVVLIFIVALAFAGAPVLGVFLLIGMLVALVWVWVKLAFISAAAVSAPKDGAVIASSAGVSQGRFWPVLGRILLVSIGLGFLANAVTAATGGLGTPVDQEEIERVIRLDGSGNLADFSLTELLPSSATLIGFVLVTTVIRAATTMLSTSAYVRLYLDSGAPSDL